MNYNIASIGHVVTPYQDKFAIPRQANLLPNIRCQLILDKRFPKESVRDLELFSHIWIFSIFDKNLDVNITNDDNEIITLNQPNFTVRPPRLGGNKRVGVFASRSPFRPNFLGLSLVKLHKIVYNQNITLELGNVDLVNNTPIVDIKPYIEYADSVSGQSFCGYAPDKPDLLIVSWSEIAKSQLLELGFSQEKFTYIKTAIEDILACDPRPAYDKNKIEDKQYVACLFELKVKFKVNLNELNITEIKF